MFLFFDTETTGMIDRETRLVDHPCQPDIVQLAAVLMHTDWSVMGELNVLIHPGRRKGPKLTPEAFAKHGISDSMCETAGVSLGCALRMFQALAEQADVIVCHNMAFDSFVLHTAFARANMNFEWSRGKPSRCTMLESTPVLKLPNPKHGSGNYKWPSLQEAHKHFYECDFENAHNAMADVWACQRVFAKLLELESNAHAPV